MTYEVMVCGWSVTSNCANQSATPRPGVLVFPDAVAPRVLALCAPGAGFMLGPVRRRGASPRLSGRSREPPARGSVSPSRFARPPRESHRPG